MNWQYRIAKVDKIMFEGEVEAPNYMAALGLAVDVMMQRMDWRASEAPPSLEKFVERERELAMEDRPCSMNVRTPYGMHCVSVTTSTPPWYTNRGFPASVAIRTTFDEDACRPEKAPPGECKHGDVLCVTRGFFDNAAHGTVEDMTFWHGGSVYPGKKLPGQNRWCVADPAADDGVDRYVQCQCGVWPTATCADKEAC